MVSTGLTMHWVILMMWEKLSHFLLIDAENADLKLIDVFKEKRSSEAPQLQSEKQKTDKRAALKYILHLLYWCLCLNGLFLSPFLYLHCLFLEVILNLLFSLGFIWIIHTIFSIFTSDCYQTLCNNTAHNHFAFFVSKSLLILFHLHGCTHVGFQMPSTIPVPLMSTSYPPSTVIIFTLLESPFWHSFRQLQNLNSRRMVLIVFWFM